MSNQTITVNVNTAPRRHHRHWPYCGQPRYKHWWYYVLGGWAFELHFWILVGYWWLAWATVAAILHEAAKLRELPAWWGPVMDATCPRWPQKMNAAAKRRPKPGVTRWHPKPIR